MSEMEFVLLENRGFIIEETVFEIVLSGARGPSGTANLTIYDAKATLVGADTGIIADSEAGYATKKFTLTNLVTFLTGFFGTKAAVALNTTHRGLANNPHSVTAAQAGAAKVSSNEPYGTISGAFNIDPNNGTEKEGSISTTQTGTLVNFNAANPSATIRFVVTSGTPSIPLTHATATIDFITTQTLTNLSPGTYIGVFQYFSTVNAFAVTVGLKP